MEKRSPDELKEIGNGFFSVGKYNEAIRYYSLALAADPLDAEAYDSRGVTLFQLFKIDEAKKDILSALEINPNFNLALHHMSEIEINQHNLSSARSYIEKAISLEPDNVIALTNLAYIELNEKNYQACIDVCKKILNEYPADKWGLEYRASCYIALKEYNEAIKDYKKLLDVENSNGSYYNDIGYAYSN